MMKGMKMVLGMKKKNQKWTIRLQVQKLVYYIKRAIDSSYTTILIHSLKIFLNSLNILDFLNTNFLLSFFSLIFRINILYFLNSAIEVKIFFKLFMITINP